MQYTQMIIIYSVSEFFCFVGLAEKKGWHRTNYRLVSMHATSAITSRMESLTDSPTPSYG